MKDVPLRQELLQEGFRWLQSFRRFWRWGKTIFSSIKGAVRAKANEVAGGAGSADDAQDFGCSPNYYQQLIESLELPDRPILTRFERALPGEASAIRRVSRIAASTVINSYCEVRKADPAAKAMRDQHAKPHACLRARFIVNDNLPAGFGVGVFSPNRTYEAKVRFSNAFNSRQSDRKGDGRGMAVKLLSVSGHSILSTLVPSWSGGEQDFLMTNHPVFFCKNVADYLAFMNILALPRDTFIASIIFGVRFITFFVPWRFRQALIFLTIDRKKIESPLRTAYHSMTPYQLGGNKVVRYSVTPVQSPLPVFPTGTETPTDNFLHDSLVAELDPTRHELNEKAVFDFSVQVRSAAKPDDVEDASRSWKQPNDEMISLGRIEIPLQAFDRPDQLSACEDLSFNPWNALPEHRPLGGLNRMRLAVYLASLQVRRRLNLVATGADPPLASVST